MKNRIGIIVIFVLIFCLVLGGSLTANGAETKKIVVGAKDFTEQYVLGNMISLLLQENGFKVEEKFGTAAAITRAALISGQIDLMPDYTGTASAVYFKYPEKINDPVELYERVKKDDLEQNNMVWMGRTSFNNTYALAIKKDMINEMGTTISSLAEYVNKDPEKVLFAVNHTFYEREHDGIFAMAKFYGMNILRKNVKAMDTGLTYEAINRNQVNVAMVFGTDAKLKKFNLLVLEDDKNFFPIYNISIVIRKDVLDKYPEIEKILLPITTLIDTEAMINLNYEVDGNGKPARIVAEEFLKEKGLIK
ncbi:MAG TPA: glycine/betaine ABC transporter substrate-binding protein [Candidatus Atribacteria bacterium]|nr:glycine/betaine ABC transporter substrate-binding protein [Candidatus Atribacteria bacterium]